jgi:hypothetical protein
MVTNHVGNDVWEAKMPIIINNPIPGVSIRLTIFIGGVTFSDGSLQKTLVCPGDFSSMGEATVNFLKSSSSGSNCHRITVFQNSIMIGHKQ